MNHLAVNCVGGGGQVAVVGGEGETFVESHRQPGRLETLSVQPLRVRLGEAALDVFSPGEMPPGGTEVLGGLLEPVEHVLPAQSQHVVHGVPVLGEPVELRVVELDGRDSHAGVGAGLAAALQSVRLLGEVPQLVVAAVPVPGPVVVNHLALRQLGLQTVGNVEVEKVQGEAGVVLHAQRSAGILQSVVSVQSHHLALAQSALQQQRPLVPSHGLVGPEAEVGGDEDPVGVLRVVLQTTKVDLRHLRLVLLSHALQLEVGGDLHGELHAGSSHVQSTHRPRSEDEALGVPGRVDRLHRHQLLVGGGVVLLLELAQDVVDGEPLVDPLLFSRYHLQVAIREVKVKVLFDSPPDVGQHLLLLLLLQESHAGRGEDVEGSLLVFLTRNVLTREHQ